MKENHFLLPVLKLHNKFSVAAPTVLRMLKPRVILRREGRRKAGDMRCFIRLFVVITN